MPGRKRQGILWTMEPRQNLRQGKVAGVSKKEKRREFRRFLFCVQSRFVPLWSAAGESLLNVHCRARWVDKASARLKKTIYRLGPIAACAASGADPSAHRTGELSVQRTSSPSSPAKDYSGRSGGLCFRSLPLRRTGYSAAFYPTVSSAPRSAPYRSPSLSSSRQIP